MRRLLIALACTLITGTTHAQTRYVYQQCPNGQCPQQVRYYYPTYAQPQQVAQAQPAVVQASYTQTTATTTTSGDPYGFLNWINAVRAQYRLGAVGWSDALAYDASVNSSRGFAHTYMGHARRQNVGWGAAGTVWSMWLGHGPHASALLDPSITAIGIAYTNGIWTYNAY